MPRGKGGLKIWDFEILPYLDLLHHITQHTPGLRVRVKICRTLRFLLSLAFTNTSFLKLDHFPEIISSSSQEIDFILLLYIMTTY